MNRTVNLYSLAIMKVSLARLFVDMSKNLG